MQYLHLTPWATLAVDNIAHKNAVMELGQNERSRSYCIPWGHYISFLQNKNYIVIQESGGVGVSGQRYNVQKKETNMPLSL